MSIPRGESPRPSATPSLDQAFLVQFGITGPQLVQTMSELGSVRQVLLKTKQSRKLSWHWWARVGREPCSNPLSTASGRREWQENPLRTVGTEELP